MKTTETKISASIQRKNEQTQSLFFKKEGDPSVSESQHKLSPFGGGKGEESKKPFFSPTTIQPKLTIGEPNDKYEQEADRMAETVIQRLADPTSFSPSGGGQGEEPLSPSGGGKGEELNTHTSFSGGAGGGIQRKCTACEEEDRLQKMEGEEEMISKKEITLQRKPIFESNDDEITPSGGGKGEEHATFSSVGGVVGGTLQRKCATCETEDELIQEKSETNSTNTASSDLQSRLNSTKGSGSPLPQDTQSSMGTAFGTDFNGVRIHTDSSAVQMNKELGAQAFTHGSDIYFNSGKYDTSSTAGKRLLAHELTHTVQQGGGGEASLSCKFHEAKTPLIKIVNLVNKGFVQRQEHNNNKGAFYPESELIIPGTGEQSRSFQENEYPLIRQLELNPFCPLISEHDPAIDTEGNNFGISNNQTFLYNKPQNPEFKVSNNFESSSFKPQLFPKNPNKTYLNWLGHVEKLLIEKEKLGNEIRAEDSLDMNYWFARVYYHTTKAEVDAIKSGTYQYPIMKLQQVSNFYRLYRTNLINWFSGNKELVEKHWQAAFKTGDLIQNNIRNREEDKSQITGEDVFLALLPSIEAHIRMDLPRTISQVYTNYYEGIPCSSMEDFRNDYTLMDQIFEEAFFSLGEDIEKVVSFTDPANYGWIRRIAFNQLGSFFQTHSERQMSWEKAHILRGRLSLYAKNYPMLLSFELKQELTDKIKEQYPNLAEEAFEVGGWNFIGSFWEDFDWFKEPEEVIENETPISSPIIVK